MRGYIISGLLIALAIPAFAQSRAPRHMSIADKLNEPIASFDFTDTPFDQVIDYLTDLTHLNIVVRWQTLEGLGIERDKPINVKLVNVRLSQVLWNVMNDAGGPDVKLAYRAQGNVLVLSTAEDLGNEMFVRVYDIADLLARVPRFTNAPQLDLSQASQGGGGGAGGGGGGSSNIFGSNSGSSDEDEDENDTQEGEESPDVRRLIELIRATIEPDSWAETSGEGKGTIMAFRNQQLVVRNNIKVHQLLDRGALDIR